MDWFSFPTENRLAVLLFCFPNSILVEVEKQAIENKRELLYAYGFVEYWCVFDCKERPHESRFGYVYNFPQSGEPQMLKGFMPDGPEAYNRST